MAGQDFQAIADLHDRHQRHALQQLDHDVLVVRVEVLHHNEGQARGGRHMAEKLFKRFEPAGRGTDADDGEGRGGRVRIDRRVRHRGRRICQGLGGAFHG